MRGHFIFLLVFVFVFSAGIALFLNGNFLADKKNVDEVGVVIVNKATGNFYLLDLPECIFVDTAKGEGIRFVDDQQPVLQYRLAGTGIRFENFTGRWTRVKGKSETTERVLRPPEIICIQGPCEATIKENVLKVETINPENMLLSKCQKEYLERNYSSSI